MKNCKKIAIFLKIAKNRGRDFREGQVCRQLIYKEDKDGYWGNINTRYIKEMSLWKATMHVEANPILLFESLFPCL